MFVLFEHIVMHKHSGFHFYFSSVALYEFIILCNPSENWIDTMMWKACPFLYLVDEVFKLS